MKNHRLPQVNSLAHVQEHSVQLNRKVVYLFLSLFFLTLLISSLPAQASPANKNTEQSQANRIIVEGEYIRESPPGAYATAAFMTLHNTSNQDIYLVGAKTNLAKIVEIHAHRFENGMMKMFQVPEIKIPAKGSIALQPGGYHIMLIEPSATINQVKTVSLDLIFKDHSTQLLSLPVKKRNMKLREPPY